MAKKKKDEHDDIDEAMMPNRCPTCGIYQARKSNCFACQRSARICRDMNKLIFYYQNWPDTKNLLGPRWPLIQRAVIDDDARCRAETQRI
jgi:hypothetical protein